MRFPIRIKSLWFFHRSYKPLRTGRQSAGITFRPARAQSRRGTEEPETTVATDASVGWPKPQHRWMV
jgi:hypothetical protein